MTGINYLNSEVTAKITDSVKSKKGYKVNFTLQNIGFAKNSINYNFNKSFKDGIKYIIGLIKNVIQNYKINKNNNLVFE